MIKKTGSNQAFTTLKSKIANLKNNVKRNYKKGKSFSNRLRPILKKDKN